MAREPLVSHGQVKIGDALEIVQGGTAPTIIVKVEDIANPGTPAEEVIIDNQQNKFFILSMYLSHTSWAKHVDILRGHHG